MAHQVVARQEQQTQLVFRLRALFHLVAIPALERRARVDALRHALIVETRRSVRRRPARPGGATCVPVARYRASSLRLCAKNGSFVSNSPSTSAPRMNSSRARAGSCLPKLTRRRVIDRQAVQRRALERRRPAPRFFSQCGSESDFCSRCAPTCSSHSGSIFAMHARVQPARLDQFAPPSPSARLSSATPSPATDRT